MDAVPPIGRGEALPGFQLAIESVTGGGGPGGAFRVGDRPTVRFRVTNATTGDVIPPSEWAFGEVLMSGPSSNYQLILNQRDLAMAVVSNPDGSFSYTLPQLPANVPDQLNFTGMRVGELMYQDWLVGQPLPDGTYTIAISARKDYEIATSEGTTTVERDAGTATVDVLFGAATQLEPREVVTDAHCVRCHGTVRAHGENRYTVKNCLMCHTAGAEDPNPAGVPADDPGTPGRTIDFATMIHKIHSGSALPSVNGVATNPDGTRDYTATPRAYQLLGFRDSVHDYSEVVFPPWPGTIGTRGMPRDMDYDDPGTDQSAQNAINGGAFNCAQCHGDPDGDGPVAAPAQADLVLNNPTRASCLACHDDWDPEVRYVANTGAGMPATPTDGGCAQCHIASGNALAVADAHVHPMLKGAPFTLGLEAEITAVRDVNGDGDGVLEPGESVEIDMTLADRDGMAVDPAVITGFAFGADGPGESPNAIYYSEFRQAWFYGAGPTFTIRAPDTAVWEEAIVPPPPLTTEGVGFVRSVSGPIQDLGAATLSNTFARTINPGMPADDVPLTAAASMHQGFVEVAPGAITSFPAGEVVRIDPMDGSSAAFYAQVESSESDGTTGIVHLRNVAVSGVSIRRVGTQPLVDLTTMSVIRPVGPTSGLGTANVLAVDPVANTITLDADPGANAVLVSYVTDFVVPSTYPGNPLRGEEIGIEAGEWEGLPIVDGGYDVRFYAWRRFFVDPTGALTMTAPSSSNPNTDYGESTPATSFGVTVGGGMAAGWDSAIPAAETCYSCHSDLQFHSGYGTRRGYDTCLLCHGVSGAEGDESVEFRSLIHHLHAPAYPWFVGGIANCESCHGEGSDSWKEPTPRFYPTATGDERQDWSWRIVCTSCHDDTATEAHAASNTVGGLEACATCHGEGKTWAVDLVHVPR